MIALAAAALIVALACGIGRANAATGDGKAVFDQLCSGCHTIGGGTAAGPDLAGLAGRRDVDWARAFIASPETVIASGDATATQLVADFGGVKMPNLGVTEAQMAVLLPYLGFTAATATPPTTTTTTPAPAPAPTPAPAAGGDAERGKDLFTGAADLSAEGPSCMSCHPVAGVGDLGGGQVGPDLTGAYAKYGGAQGLAASLTSVPFPTMAPIFTRKPLTSQEQADLVAFLATAPDQQRASAATWKLVGLSLVGVALLCVVAYAIWNRRRLDGVRKPLVNRARGK